MGSLILFLGVEYAWETYFCNDRLKYAASLLQQLFFLLNYDYMSNV